MSTEEIYAKINNVEKITPEEIDKTKKYIKQTTNEILKKFKADDYIWKESSDQFITDDDLIEDEVTAAIGDGAVGGAGLLPPAENVPTGDITSPTDNKSTNSEIVKPAKGMSDFDILFGGKPWDGKLNQNNNPKSFLMPKNIFGKGKILKRYPYNVNMKQKAKKKNGVTIIEDDFVKEVNNIINP